MVRGAESVALGEVQMCRLVHARASGRTFRGEWLRGSWQPTQARILPGPQPERRRLVPEHTPLGVEGVEAQGHVHG